MRREEQTSPALLAREDVPELAPRQRVEARRRLVEHDELRATRQRADRRELAPHAAAQLGAEVRQPIVQVKRPQQLVGGRARLVAAAFQDRAEVRVLPYGQFLP